jgi:hypothetical protein
MSVNTFSINVTKSVAAAVLILDLLSPANAAPRHQDIALLSDPHTGSIETNAALGLTSQLPWRAPVGHRQPQRADVPQHQTVSALEQRQADQELDRRLVICRGC